MSNQIKVLDDLLAATYSEWKNLSLHNRNPYTKSFTLSSILNAAGGAAITFAQVILDSDKPDNTVNYNVVAYTANHFLFTYRKTEAQEDITTTIYARSALESIEVLDGPVGAISTAPDKDFVLSLAYRGGITVCIRDRAGLIKQSLLDELRNDLLRLDRAA